MQNFSQLSALLHFSFHSAIFPLQLSLFAIDSLSLFEPPVGLAAISRHEVTIRNDANHVNLIRRHFRLILPRPCPVNRRWNSWPEFCSEIAKVKLHWWNACTLRALVHWCCHWSGEMSNYPQSSFRYSLSLLEARRFFALNPFLVSLFLILWSRDQHSAHITWQDLHELSEYLGNGNFFDRFQSIHGYSCPIRPIIARILSILHYCGDTCGFQRAMIYDRRMEHVRSLQYLSTFQDDGKWRRGPGSIDEDWHHCHHRRRRRRLSRSARRHSRATSWSVRQATGCLLEFPHRLESRMLARAREGLEVSERGCEKVRKRERARERWRERERKYARGELSTLSLAGKTLSRAHCQPLILNPPLPATFYSSSVSRWPFSSSVSLPLFSLLPPPSLSLFIFPWHLSILSYLEVFESLQIRWHRSYWLIWQHRTLISGASSLSCAIYYY